MENPQFWKRNVLLICCDNALLCIVLYIFGMYHYKLQYTFKFVPHSVSL